MDYHMLDIYTLKSMSNDVRKEISNLTERLSRLKEQKEVIDMIVIFRTEQDKKDKIDNNTLIDPY